MPKQLGSRTKQLTKPPRQLDLGLKLRVADLTFFKVFAAAIINGGLVKQLGCSAFSLLLVMKANSRPSDGRIYIGINELCEQTGLSGNTVRVSIKKLLSLGYLEHKTEPGKKRHYYVFDEFQFRRLYPGETETDALDQLNQAGDVDGKVRLKYVPTRNRDDLADIQAFLHGGPVPPTATVQLVEKQLVASQVVQQQAVQQQTVVVAQPGSTVIVQADGSTRVATPGDEYQAKAERLKELQKRFPQ